MTALTASAANDEGAVVATKFENFVIYGYADSVAEAYVKENGFTCG